MNGLLVIAKHRAGRMREQTLKALAKAQVLKEKCDGELNCHSGQRIRQLSDQLSSYVQNVFYVDD